MKDRKLIADISAKPVSVDGLADREQIAARERRTFWRLGLCSGSPADSPNQVHLQSNSCTAADHHNVKCLDLTPDPYLSPGEPQPNQHKPRPCFRIRFFGLPEEIGRRPLLHRRISFQAFRSRNQRRKDFFSRHRAASSKAENRDICQRG